MSQRKAVTKARATTYARASRAKKSQILDELVELTGWHRDYARAALRDALTPKLVTSQAPRSRRGPTYGPRIVAALITCWAVLRAPAGKRLAPMLPVLVPILRRDGELDLTDDEADLLCRMSAATIDRRLAPERAKMMPRGRSHTKPCSLLKSQIPIRTWADWDEASPGFVEIDLVGHEGGNASGEFCFTLTVTDIATGWTINRSVRNKAQKWVFEALQHVVAAFPFPIKGIDSDNGSAFVDSWLLRSCACLGVKLVHSRPGKPQGRGKIERFFRTVREQFLVEITDEVAADITGLAELNRLLAAWIETVYHPAIHSETGQAPLPRWLGGVADPLPLPAPAQLREAFRWSEHRTVTKSAIVSLQGNRYRVDESLVGRKVELVFDPFDLTDIEIRYRGMSHGKAVCFTIGRHAHSKARPEHPPTPAEPSGIDYLALLDTAHTEALESRINYTALFGEDSGTRDDGGAADGQEVRQ